MNQEEEERDELKRFSVKYIARAGYTDEVMIVARSKGEAKRIAAERGYDDILGVRSVGLPTGVIVAVVLILSLIVLLVVK